MGHIINFQPKGIRVIGREEKGRGPRDIIFSLERELILLKGVLLKGGVYKKGLIKGGLREPFFVGGVGPERVLTAGFFIEVGEIFFSFLVGGLNPEGVWQESFPGFKLGREETPVFSLQPLFSQQSLGFFPFFPVFLPFFLTL